jgi:DNA-binding transcriptional LysR family regulator
MRYSVAVAERLSLSEATQQLQITVHPLSCQIRQLKESLTAPLPHLRPLKACA